MGLMAILRGLFVFPQSLLSFAGRSCGVFALRGNGRGRLRLGTDGAGGGAFGVIPTAIKNRTAFPESQIDSSRLVRVVLVAFDQARRFFPAAKIDMVRQSRARQVGGDFDGRRRKWRSKRPGILVVGGSQGARAVNDLVMAAVEVLT